MIRVDRLGHRVGSRRGLQDSERLSTEALFRDKNSSVCIGTGHHFIDFESVKSYGVVYEAPLRFRFIAELSYVDPSRRPNLVETTLHGLLALEVARYR